MKYGLLAITLGIIGLAAVEGLLTSHHRLASRIPASLEKTFFEKGNIRLGLMVHGIKTEDL